jgi:heme/copper-type cytochrome/quinol oxidase subunit 1
VSTTAGTSPAALAEAWGRAPGVAGWLADTRHRTTAVRLAVAGLGLFALAGLAALVMRTQLAQPGNHVVGPGGYDQLFSLHGTSMMLLFTVPVTQAFALYLVPLEIGTRDAALPRLAAFGLWLYVFAGLALWGSLLFDEAPSSGWFSYPPLSSPRYEPNYHGDVYAGTVLLSQTAAICVAIPIIATILCRRAPGMRLSKMPLLAWAVLIAMLMVVMAMPSVIVAATLLFMDSKMGAHFFGASAGGDPILWEHLFWFFGHPLVYLILLPGLGIVSSVTATFARRPMAGYPFIVTSYVAIGIISFGVWVHHMFAAGRVSVGIALFSAATMAVAVPSGIHVFAVLATLWHGRVRFAVPLLYVIGFLVIFVLGGLSGVSVGSVPADWQYHDTYWVVAHFHYVLLGGVVMPIFAGLYHWFPKVTGRMPDARLGVLAFALKFIGIHLAFFPMHILGIRGMPRRMWTYPHGLGWDGPNLLATIGAYMVAAGVLVFFAALAVGFRRPRAPADPWGGGTLEWATTSPPPPHTFDATPVVTTHYPLWEQDALGNADARHGVAPERGEILGTTAVDAEPERRDLQPARTAMPFVAAAALGAGVVGSIVDPLFLMGGFVIAFLAVVEWTRPRTPAGEAHRAALPGHEAAAAAGARTPLWWGTVLGLVSLFTATTLVVSTWYFLAANDRQWVIPPVEPRALWPLFALSAPIAGIHLCVRAAVERAGAGRRASHLLAAASALAVLFAAGEIVDMITVDYNQASNASGSADFAISGSYTLVALVLAATLAVAARRLATGLLGPGRMDGLRSVAAFALVGGISWPLVAFTVYVAPRLV